MKPGRNDPCVCGSGKKFKHCCEGKITARPAALPPAGANQLAALYNSKRYAELELRARTLAAQYPEAGYAWKYLGAALQMQGKNPVQAYQKAAELMPGDAGTHLNLGDALQRLEQYQGAADSYRRVLQLKPDLARAHHNLGLSLENLDQPGEAAASYRRALRLAPDSAMTHSNLGGVLISMGKTDEAMASFRRALEIDPVYLDAMLGLANLSAAAGQTQLAEELSLKVLAIDPDNIDARYKLAGLRKVKPGDSNMAALVSVDQALRNGRITLSHKNKLALHFALGKCFDDIGDPHHAFPHFLEGCKLKRASIHYDAAQVSRQFDEVIRIFDRNTIDRLHGSGNPSEVPVFVLGMPRSGTTLTEQILASHPDAHGAGELLALPRIAQRKVGTASGFPGNIAALDRATLALWADEYLDGLLQHAPGAKRITDKMPENFWVVGLIHLMLPNAKIIHVNRNPVDNCLSCFTTMFSNACEYTYDLAELGRYYADYTRLMDHWRDVLPAGAFLDVKYEDIIADQEAEAKRIVEFCGLEWNDACLNFHKLDRSVNTASHAQVRQPIYKSSVERWRPYEPYLGPLLDALGDLAPERKP